MSEVPFKHGVTAYREGRCDCDVCADAMDASRRRRRERAAELREEKRKKAGREPEEKPTKATLKQQSPVNLPPVDEETFAALRPGNPKSVAAITSATPKPKWMVVTTDRMVQYVVATKVEVKDGILFFLDVNGSPLLILRSGSWHSVRRSN